MEEVAVAAVAGELDLQDGGWYFDSLFLEQGIQRHTACGWIGVEAGNMVDHHAIVLPDGLANIGLVQRVVSLARFPQPLHAGRAQIGRDPHHGNKILPLGLKQLQISGRNGTGTGGFPLGNVKNSPLAFAIPDRISAHAGVRFKGIGQGKGPGV